MVDPSFTEAEITALLRACIGEDRPESDVDLLADLPPGIGLPGMARVQAELEAIVGSPLDLVPGGDLKPGVRARADRDLVAP